MPVSPWIACPLFVDILFQVPSLVGVSEGTVDAEGGVADARQLTALWEEHLHWEEMLGMCQGSHWQSHLQIEFVCAEG